MAPNVAIPIPHHLNVGLLRWKLHNTQPVVKITTPARLTLLGVRRISRNNQAIQRSAKRRAPSMKLHRPFSMRTLADIESPYLGSDLSEQPPDCPEGYSEY